MLVGSFNFFSCSARECKEDRKFFIEFNKVERVRILILCAPEGRKKIAKGKLKDDPNLLNVCMYVCIYCGSCIRKTN